MLILGLLLILAGVLAILTVLFGADTADTVEVLGNDLNTVTVFLFGLGAGVAILWGFTIIKFGTKRSLQRRRERQKLTELSQKLDQVEAERTDDDRDRNSPT